MPKFDFMKARITAKLPLEVREFYRGKRVLVTGGRGYLASRLFTALAELQSVPIALTRQPLSEPSAILPFGWQSLRYEDPASWKNLLSPGDIFFHLAAQTSLREAELDPARDYVANVLPMLRIAEACRNLQPQIRIVFASTATIFGIPEFLPVDETHADCPLSIYDLHKKNAEAYLTHFTRNNFFEGVSLRLPNIYGPGNSVKNSDRNILNQMIKKACAGENLQVYAPGTFLRDYLFVEDTVRAFLLAGFYAPKFRGQPVLLGTGQGVTVLQAFQKIARLAKAQCGKEVVVETVKPENKLSELEKRDFTANAAHFSLITGWKPLTEFQDGLRRTFQYYTDHA